MPSTTALGAGRGVAGVDALSPEIPYTYYTLYFFVVYDPALARRGRDGRSTGAGVVKIL